MKWKHSLAGRMLAFSLIVSSILLIIQGSVLTGLSENVLLSEVTIDHLQKIKVALLSSGNNLRLANNKAEELSIKKLTKNAPSVKAMFDELGKEKE